MLRPIRVLLPFTVPVIKVGRSERARLLGRSVFFLLLLTLPSLTIICAVVLPATTIQSSWSRIFQL